MFPGENTWRAIHGDGDGLPGLVVDRYGDYLSVQFLIPAMEQRRDILVPLLVEQFACKGIMNRSDAGVRALEGLAQEKGLLWGEVPEPVLIREGQLELVEAVAALHLCCSRLRHETAERTHQACRHDRRQSSKHRHADQQSLASTELTRGHGRRRGMGRVGPVLTQRSGAKNLPIAQDVKGPITCNSGR